MKFRKIAALQKSFDIQRARGFTLPHDYANAFLLCFCSPDNCRIGVCYFIPRRFALRRARAAHRILYCASRLGVDAATRSSRRSFQGYGGSVESLRHQRRTLPLRPRSLGNDRAAPIVARPHRRHAVDRAERADMEWQRVHDHRCRDHGARAAPPPRTR